MKRALLLVAIWTLPAMCQTVQSNQSLHATFSNLDKEPAPYVPVTTGVMKPGPSHLSLRERRAESAPGPTLGEIQDAKEFWAPILMNQALAAPVIFLPAPTFVPPGQFFARPWR